MTPIIHCWENDITSMGGVVFYVGANNNGPAIDIPSGASNYVSDGNVPPTYFPAGYSGFLHRYAFANPPSTLTWHLTYNQSAFLVELSTQAAAHQCPQSSGILTTLTYSMEAEKFPTINQANASQQLVAAITNQTGVPASAVSALTWTATGTGFTVTFVISPNDDASVYTAATTLSSLAGEHATNDFTNKMNAAIGVTPVSLAHITSNGTSTDTVGSLVVPVGIVPDAPVPQAPFALPESPLIPFADCWEQSGATLSMYFGFNNTNNRVVQVAAGVNNAIVRLPDQSVLGAVTVFPPGFTSFAKVVTMTTPPTKSPDARWNLLNHEVKMLTRGVMQQCKATESAKIWITFSGSDATALTKVDAIFNLLASSVTNLNATQITGVINSNGQPSTYRLELKIFRGSLTQYRAAAELYNAYQNTDLATRLQALTGTQPISFHGQPTAVEVQGTSRLMPVPVPVNPAGGKLGGGAIFGIVLAVIAGIAVIVGVTWYIRKNPPQIQERERLIQ